MKSLGLFLCLAFVVALSACTTIKGTVQIVPKDMDTDKGMYNSPYISLGAVFHVKKNDDKLLATRIDNIKIQDDQISSEVKADLVAQVESGNSAEITVTPADSEIEAYAKAKYAGSAKLTSTKFTRRSIGNVSEFLDSNKELFRSQIKHYPNESIWLVTSTIVCEKMAVEYDTSIDSTLKGKFPKVVTVAVTFDTSASKKFEIGVAEMGRDGIPVFVSLQRIFLGDDGSFLTEAITAKDYLVAEWGAK